MNETWVLVVKMLYKKLTFVWGDLVTVFFLNLNGVCYRQQLSFWNWILFFVKRNTSNKSCLDISLWPPKCANHNHEYCKTLNINWTEILNSSCSYSFWFDLSMPILFPVNICFQFFEKIFFFCTSEMAKKGVFLHLQSNHLVQMKANNNIFILACF